MQITSTKYQAKHWDDLLEMMQETMDFHMGIATPSIFHSSSKKLLENYLKKLVEKIDEGQGFLYLGLVDNTPVGFVYGEIDKFSEEKKRLAKQTGTIHELYVKSDYRKLKVGTELMKEIEKKLQEVGCQIILLHEVHIQNERALKFYHKLGYKARTIELAKVI